MADVRKRVTSADPADRESRPQILQGNGAANQGCQRHQYKPRRLGGTQGGLELSAGRQEAFDIFRKEHEDSLVIEDNKVLLKQRYAEAKALGEQVNEARGRVNELKRQLEQRRMQTAAQGVTEGTTEPLEPDPVEDSLCAQIEREKTSYKNTFGPSEGPEDRDRALAAAAGEGKVQNAEGLPGVVDKRVGQPAGRGFRGHSCRSEFSADQSDPAPLFAQEQRPRGHIFRSQFNTDQSAARIVSQHGDTCQGSRPTPALSGWRVTVQKSPQRPEASRGAGTPPQGQPERLEREAESNSRNHFQLEKLHFLKNYSCLDVPALEKFVQVILDAWEKGVNPSGNSTNPSNWDFSNSFFFAGTVVTTIGYGNLSPSTYSGQVFCVFYALCGIPLNLAFLNQVGKCLTLHLGRLERGVVSAGKHRQWMEFLAVSCFLLMGSALFLVAPPLVFSYVEGWSYGEGFYYGFITLSTIGFGDYVVGTDPNKHYIPVYRALAGIWIFFGLAWLALIFNIGARVMEHIIQLTNPPHQAQDRGEDPEKQQEGAGQRAIQQEV
ncbi:hypothetical protein SKAU_G00333000 [Synaphobranchus kaupii]|uniref:Uncharacterized protein n=1 Tax=Synaphobranchus kaupii TaxID=118154 RepID=A0A9Q1IIS2_SYNKA|nr:hypothetical protein SKAU_G00333000 [Synaphobranchus kaupii]